MPNMIESCEPRFAGIGNRVQGEAPRRCSPTWLTVSRSSDCPGRYDQTHRFRRIHQLIDVSCHKRFHAAGQYPVSGLQLADLQTRPSQGLTGEHMARLLHRWGGWRGPCPRATKAGRGGACPSSGPPGLGGNTGAVDRELALGCFQPGDSHVPRARRTSDRRHTHFSPHV